MAEKDKKSPLGGNHLPTWIVLLDRIGETDLTRGYGLARRQPYRVDRAGFESNSID